MCNMDSIFAFFPECWTYYKVDLSAKVSVVSVQFFKFYTVDPYSYEGYLLDFLPYRYEFPLPLPFPLHFCPSIC